MQDELKKPREVIDAFMEAMIEVDKERFERGEGMIPVLTIRDRAIEKLYGGKTDEAA